MHFAQFIRNGGVLFEHQCQIIVPFLKIIRGLGKPIAGQNQLRIQIIIREAQAVKFVFIGQLHLAHFLFALCAQSVIEYDMHRCIADPAGDQDKQHGQNDKGTARKRHKSDAAVFAHINLSLCESLAKLFQQAIHQSHSKIQTFMSQK